MGVLADLLEAYLDAAEETAYLTMCRGMADGSGPMAEIAADRDDVREALGEARFHPAGSPLWWLCVRAARVAAAGHMDAIESGLLPAFRWRTSPRERETLGRQWLAFAAARAGDGAAAGE